MLKRNWVAGINHLIPKYRTLERVNIKHGLYASIDFMSSARHCFTWHSFVWTHGHLCLTVCCIRDNSHSLLSIYWITFSPNFPWRLILQVAQYKSHEKCTHSRLHLVVIGVFSRKFILTSQSVGHPSVLELNVVKTTGWPSISRDQKSTVTGARSYTPSEKSNIFGAWMFHSSHVFTMSRKITLNKATFAVVSFSLLFV